VVGSKAANLAEDVHKKLSNEPSSTSSSGTSSSSSSSSEDDPDPWRRKVDLPPLDGLVDIPHTGTSLPAFVPTSPLTSPIARAYFVEEKSVLWLAEQMGFTDFALDHLGLHRVLTPHGLTAKQVDKLHAVDPAVASELELAINVARDLGKIMRELRHRFSAAVAHVGTIVTSFYYSDDEASRWVNRFSEFFGIFSAIAGTVRTVSGAAKAVLKLSWMKMTPKPHDVDLAETHQLWANEDMDRVMDGFYVVWREFFARARPAELRAFDAALHEHTVVLPMSSFLAEFSRAFFRHLVRGFTVYTCDPNQDHCAHGTVIDGIHYRLHIAPDAVRMMMDYGVDPRDIMLGRDGWEPRRKKYKCKIAVKSFVHACFPRLKYGEN
jgi:hypothetical protein